MSLRLSAATLGRLAPRVIRPDYAWAEQAVGIVHLGLGAFHRAHQAVYTEAAMAGGDRDWAIAGVSLRSPGARDALAPQDGLYSVTERADAAERVTVIGAVRRLLVAPEAPDALTVLLAAPATRIVTLTVTEKAYAPSGEAGALHARLACGLAERRARGLPGLTLISCDNLADNGGVLARGLAAWIEPRDPALTRWIEAECAFPATMVDRIVPATTPEDHARIGAAIGLEDAGAVVTEPFHQWVIEDRFAGPRPRWEVAGVRFVASVAPFEAAKLRLLNGAHSAIAYLGLRAGHRHVHEAIADPAIAPYVTRLMRNEAAATLDPAPGQDLASYIDRLLARFANAGLPHRLAQIAADGSQKIPQRWLRPLAINARQGRHCPATLRALAAWVLYLRGDVAPVHDPRGDELTAVCLEAGNAAVFDALFGPYGAIQSDWSPGGEDRRLFYDALDELAGAA